MFHSPLRYPGGKRKLANFMALVLRTNRLSDGEYVEPYAGGAAVALSLLYGEHVRRIHINDLDRGVYSFGNAALNNTSDLCRRIRTTEITRDEWERQRLVQAASDPDPFDLGFSTFYLNRTNRSGIIRGGMIGGKAQTGRWKIDARFNREDLVRRIERVGRWRSRIELSNLDASRLLQGVEAALPDRSLLYLDPPYYFKGQEELYVNCYGPSEHGEIAALVRLLDRPWVVSYDDVTEIKDLYRGYRSLRYSIAYTAHDVHRGQEVAFVSPRLRIPDVEDPTRITLLDVERAPLFRV
jgi:DNA adenine methylase